MHIDDILPGDILLFSYVQDDFESRAIAYMTEAPVSHAAMAYSTPGEIIEETPPHVTLNKAALRFPGRTVYVMRHQGNKDLSPVIAASNQYLEESQPYSKASLYTLGLLFAYKKWAPRGQHSNAFLKLLQFFILELNEMMNNRDFPGKHPMVCSQFVAQCFIDAGEGYELGFNPLIVDENLSPIDAAIELCSGLGSESLELDLSCIQCGSDVQSLLKSLLAEEAGTEQDDDSNLELAKHLAHFAFLLAKTGYLGTVPDKINVLDALLLLKESQALFISPMDLLKNCKNLKQVGVIEIPQD